MQKAAASVQRDRRLNFTGCAALPRSCPARPDRRDQCRRAAGRARQSRESCTASTAREKWLAQVRKKGKLPQCAQLWNVVPFQRCGEPVIVSRPAGFLAGFEGRLFLCDGHGNPPEISRTARSRASPSCAVVKGPGLARTTPCAAPMRAYNSGAHCKPVRTTMP